MQRMRGMHGPQAATAADADQDLAAIGTPDRGRRPWSLMVVLSMAQFMVILDATVVNVALPSIARSLGFAAGGLQWVVTAYVLASGGLVLLGGRAAEPAPGAAGVSSAAPTPWPALAAISAPATGARPLASDAAVNNASPVRKTRRLPATSAARPPSSTRPPLART